MGRLESLNPATGELVGAVDVSSASQITEAVARARAAQGAWAQLGVHGRAELLRAAAGAFEEAADRVAALLTAEMGKPLREASGEIRSCYVTIDAELAESAAALAPEELTDSRTRSVIFHDPYGVCAAITPWNFPFSMPHWLVFPALAAGNTVVLKPSEETPLVGQAYVDLLAPLLPEGVLEIVHGRDEQGAALVASDVDLIAFTGSRQTGKKILAGAARSLKRVILELGGKDPMIVMDDADLDKAARFAASNSFRNAGQVCVSTERIFVPESIADRFVDLLVKEASTMPVGDGAAEGTRVGPMINQRQREHVVAQVRAAVEDGATIAYQGEVTGENFIAPTVLTGVTEAMDIAREETFGPIACVTVVTDVADAVARANASPYGLGAVVFSSDTQAAESVARQLRAGMVGINRGVGGVQGSPWVGARESGYGFHGSRDGHRQFTQTRVVSRPL